MRTYHPRILFQLCLLLMFCSSARAAGPEYDGIIVPSQVVEVGAPVAGIVQDVLVERGLLIARDQVLVRLHSSVERATLDAAAARAGCTSEISLLQTQLEYARRANTRIQAMQSAPALEKDQAATEAALAELRLAQARENLLLAEMDRRKASAVLNRCTITSPLAGIVMDRYVSPGEYVNNQPLLRIARVDPLWVEVIVPAAMFGKIRMGQDADLITELSGYGQPRARVIVVDRYIDAASNTFGIRLELPNPDSKIPSGLKCQVRFVENATADVENATEQ